MTPKVSVFSRNIKTHDRDIEALKREMAACKAKNRVEEDVSETEEEEEALGEEEEMDPDDVIKMKFLKDVKKDGHGKIDVTMYGGKIDSEELLN